MTNANLTQPEQLESGNSKVLCTLLGVTHSAVARLKNEGVLRQLPGPRGKWNLNDCVHAYIRYTRDNRPGRGSREDKTTQETRKLQLLNDEKEGRLLNIDHGSAVFSEYCSSVRAGITALPGRLSAQVSGMSNPSEIRALIHEEVTELLDAAETLFGEIHALAKANADDGGGAADSKTSAKPVNGAVGRRKPSAPKRKRRARKVA